MPNGTIILINGASSSGKTTLARVLQQELVEPFLHIEVDQFGPMLPRRYFVGQQSNWVALDPAPDALTAQAFYLQTVQEGCEARWHIKTGPVGRRLIAGMHRAVAALAGAGNHVIMVDVLYDPEYLKDYLAVLQRFTVWFVGVHCPPDIIEQRERERGDRLVGHTRGHLHMAHAHASYDIEVDTAACAPNVCAQQIIARMQTGAPPEAFNRLRQQFGVGAKRRD